MAPPVFTWRGPQTSLRQLAPDAVWSGGCMIAIISQSSPLIAQVAARVALLAGFILLTLASTGEWVPVQVLTAGMLCCAGQAFYMIRKG